MINTTITDEFDETPTCVCGAALGEGQTLCRKCRARELWLKRQEGKRKASTRRGETRRPAGRPRNRSQARVIWS
ncbi:hypothetical protein ACFFMN_29500 [Planobispora siamensis]|uniref:Uncharacterized protein n=1 Tax=Planobispora siamensis TaxID=936338 RepID=A0A8J3SLA0_9ACTN|nr:hypothetical protein [Planobispora siamensis]GIH91678.1 hypothetical protein Psi01_23080 [Planobispora siamensis]